MLDGLEVGSVRGGFDFWGFNVSLSADPRRRCFCFGKRAPALI
jgi:hypothetical protein